MWSKLKVKCSEGWFRNIPRSRSDRRRTSLNMEQLPALAGLSPAGLFADRAGLDAFVVGDCGTGKAEVGRAIG